MKRKLLFAMLCIVSVLGLKAQTWPAQEPAEGDFYLYNVGTGTFLSCGEDWGTYAVVNNGALKFTLKSNGAGAYTLLTTSYFSYGNPNAAQLQSSGYVDQNVTATTWTFTSVGNGAYTMRNAAGTYLYAPSDGTIKISLNEAAPSNNYGYWKLINYANLFEGASEVNPVDVTCLISDANFESSKSTSNLKWTMDASNQNLSGGTSPNKCAESYHSTFTLSQTITVPNGNYKISAQGFYRQDGSDNTNLPYFYLNNEKVAFPVKTGNEGSMSAASTSFTAGNYKVESDVVTVTTGSITLGAKLETNTGLWCIWDNIKLTYLGVDLTALRTALQGQIDAVADFENTIPTAAYNNLKSYADGIDVASLMTEDAIAEASTELSTRVNTATALQALYTRYQNIKTAVLALDDDATIFTGDATINTTTTDTELEAATTADDINSAIATLRGVASSFIGAVTVNDGKSFNITNIFITNPAPWANTDGWTCPVAATPNPSARAAEFWNKSGVSISQEMASLPVGYYTLRAQAFARTGCAPIYIFAGAADTDSSDDNIQELIKKSNSEISTMAAAGTWFDSGNGWNTFTYQNETAGSFTIGLKDEFKPNGSHGDGNDGWLIWRQFELLYLGTEPVSVLAELYKDAKDAAVAARDNATYANVVGAERAALLAAIADTPEETADSYKAKTSALIVATNSFIDDGVVLAWNNYATAFDAERTKALALGLDAETVNSYAANSSTTSAGATACIKNLMVAEYNFVSTNYTEEVEINPSSWTTTGEVGTMTSQHWDGTDSSVYYEQSGAAWGSSSWNLGYNTTVSLPAGNYVFKVAGRKSSNSVNMVLSVAYNEENFTVNDFPNGDTGLGINKAGATSYDAEDEAGFANGTAGRGWQWRYVKFALAAPTDVTLNITGTANAQYQWLGFCNASLLTDDPENVALIESLVALTKAKNAATLVERTNKGTGVFQFDKTTDDGLWSAYSTAKSNADAFTLTNESTSTAVDALTTALTTAQNNYASNNVLVQPNAEKRYVLTFHADGHDADGNAITFIVDGRADEGGYGIKYLTATNASMNQAFKFTSVNDPSYPNSYKVSAINVADGSERYFTTRATYNNEDADKNLKLRTTDDANKAMWITIGASETVVGQFQLLNGSSGNAVIAHNGNNNNDMYTANSANFTIAEATQASVPGTVAAGKYATRIFPFIPELPSGITAYSCEEVDGSTMTLVEVNTPAANTPYILFNSTESPVDITLSGWGMAGATSYETGYLTGVYASTAVPTGSYVLQTLNDKQAFYIVDAEAPVNAPAYRAYLTVPAAPGVKAFFFDEATGIENLNVNESLKNEAIYNVAGQRVSKAQKGLYIKNGKKVVIK